MGGDLIFQDATAFSVAKQFVLSFWKAILTATTYNRVIYPKQLFMKSLPMFFFIASLLVAPVSRAQVCNGALLWSDEFDGASLDANKWSYQTGNGCPGLCGWGNSEQEYYTNSANNVYVSNGVLVLKVIKESISSSSFSSGKILTKNHFSHTYGRFEARMRLPKGTGLWPAFWMLPNTNSWPTTGEIDIMEYRGDQTNITQGTLHYGQSYPNNLNDGNSYTFPSGLDLDFHVYAVEWTANDIKWYIDNTLFKTETKNPNSLTPASNSTVWPWTTDFHVILNLAVGGWFTGNPSTANVQLTKPTFEIDYVRVYDLNLSGHTQTAYNGSTYSLPGKIEAENYDNNCRGVYYDINETNLGGQYRADGVDIENCLDAGGGYDVGYSEATEWQEYSVNVATASTFTVAVRVASGGTGSSMHVEVDNVNVTGAIDVANTGGWQTWQTLTSKSFELTAGNHIVRLAYDGANINCNYMEWKDLLNKSFGVSELRAIQVEDFADRILFHNSAGAKVQVFDIAGAQVGCSFVAVDKALQLNKTDLPAGIYLYQLNDKAGRFVVY